ncbi:serine/threonine-protein kinase pim-2-like [Megalobrama amblycephala]|uniref:serine/threonine-protein kinase pim-2-like n=1 Tax=Megalobrama amblycephala TaxID=75352 RepID=UPI00201451BE|nr:serine/threonine-protein kinase pim-2-like [Megalobrama amblycephala]
MVMEWPSPCTDLLSFMDVQGGSLDEKTARHVMRQVIQTANICCERGVFHRDVKPENLLVNPDTMEVKLIDFGCGEMVCGVFPTAQDLYTISANIWTSPGLSEECCDMICAYLQPKPQKRLALKKMHLHD